MTFSGRVPHLRRGNRQQIEAPAKRLRDLESVPCRWIEIERAIFVTDSSSGTQAVRRDVMRAVRTPFFRLTISPAVPSFFLMRNSSVPVAAVLPAQQ